MKLRWTRLALEDLKSLSEYISRDNPTAAEKTVHIIHEKIHMLLQHPAMGRPGRIPETRELYIEGSRYIVPYRVSGTEIHIIRVLHTSRKWP